MHCSLLRLLTCRQVKCCGRLPSCTRCIDKGSHCHYSVSMAGKVVGKRKRHEPHCPRDTRVRLDDWNVTVGPPPMMPSPAPTHTSVRTSKSTSASTTDWTSYIAFDDEQKDAEGFAPREQDVAHQHLSSDSTVQASGMTPTTRPGLLTPSESPPDTHFTMHSTSTIDSQNSTMLPAYPASAQHHFPSQTNTTSIIESHPNDGQMLCLNLLGNLRRVLVRPQLQFGALLALITNTNAVIQRILRQKSIRSDYTGQLMLSVACIYLVNLCELLKKAEAGSAQSQSRGARPEQEPLEPATSTEENQARSRALMAVHDVRQICSNVGDLLKRKPLAGFQVLGRQESAHIELEIRLDQVLSCF